MMSRMSTGSLEIVEERGELGDVALVGQHETRKKFGTSVKSRVKTTGEMSLCVVRQVEGLVYLVLLWD